MLFVILQKYLVDLFLDENFTERWGTWERRDVMWWTMRLQLLRPKSQDHFHAFSCELVLTLFGAKIPGLPCHHFPWFRCTTTMVFTAKCCSFWEVVWIWFWTSQMYWIANSMDHGGQCTRCMHSIDVDWYDLTAACSVQDDRTSFCRTDVLLHTRAQNFKESRDTVHCICQPFLRSWCECCPATGGMMKYSAAFFQSLITDVSWQVCQDAMTIYSPSVCDWKHLHHSVQTSQQPSLQSGLSK